MAASPIETALLRQLDTAGSIQDTGDYAQSQGYEHNELVGVLKSLDGTQMVISKVPTRCLPVPLYATQWTSLNMVLLNTLLHTCMMLNPPL